MVELERLENQLEIAELRGMLERHVEYTGSTLAKRILNNWSNSVNHFIRVIPRDYKRMLEQIDKAKATGLVGDEALLAAFQANAQDESRVGGN